MQGLVDCTPTPARALTWDNLEGPPLCQSSPGSEEASAVTRHSMLPSAHLCTSWVPKACPRSTLPEASCLPGDLTLGRSHLTSACPGFLLIETQFCLNEL